MTVIIYGIRNCDTMKKAFAWLQSAGIDYSFHDLRGRGIERAKVEGWVADKGLDTVLNRNGRTFRTLPEETRAAITGTAAIDAILAEPTMIRRPVLEVGDRLEIGFKPERYAALFKG